MSPFFFLGTDDYQIDQGGSVYHYYGPTSYYSLDLTDTVSSTWHDVGADALTDGDSMTGETDSYIWSDFNSMTDGVSESTISGTYTFNRSDSLSLADTGSETLGTDATDTASWTLDSESDQFDLQDSLANGRTVTWLSDVYGVITSRCLTEADGFSLDDYGNDSISGTSSSESDSYQLSQYVIVPLAYGLLYTVDDPYYGWEGEPLYFTDFEEDGVVSGSPASHSSNWEESGVVGTTTHTWSSTLGSDLTGYLEAEAALGVDGLNPAVGGLLSAIEADSQQMTGSSRRTSGRGGFQTAGWGSSTPYSRGNWGFNQGYVAPDVMPLYLSASALDLGVAGLGYLPAGSTFGLTPSTNAATANGLPDQEATALGNMALNQGAPDGVSQSAPTSPTTVLVTLAAAGRNPTDITLPTVGSEAVDPPPGSHEVAENTAGGQGMPQDNGPPVSDPNWDFINGLVDWDAVNAWFDWLSPPRLPKNTGTFVNAADVVGGFVGKLIATAPTPEDVENAYSELLKNSQFRQLLPQGIDESVEIVVDTETTNRGLALTEQVRGPDGKPTGKVVITIFINNPEFREWKRTNPDLYDQLLYEVIVHEMIHAYLFLNPDNELDLDHDPARFNLRNNGFGAIGWWMRYRYPAAKNDILVSHRRSARYNLLYLDIGPKSQKYLIGIVGGKTPNPRER